MPSPNADDGASGRGPVRWRRPSALLLAWITFLLQNRRAAALEPVRLQPLHFLRSVAAGDNVQTMCAVQSGDEVDFSWRKDGQPLSASGHRLVIHSLPTTSILLIKNATVFDAGNYSCVGRNALGQDSVTAQLRVEGQPHWLKEPPKEVVVALGDLATLRCDVISFPHARVTWFRIGEDAVEEPPGPRWQGAGETSIELSSVSRQDVGTYRCRADNGLGQISADIQLVVRVPARFEQKFSVESVRRGDTAILRCEALGDSPMGVTWHRNEDPLPLDSPRLQVFESVTDRGTASELHVQGAERSDNGLFSCLAKNGFGTDRRSIKLVVLEVPSAPFDVKVEQSWSRSASVRWNAPYSGNSPVSKYIVQYWKDHGAAHRLEEAIVVAPQTSTLLRDLQPGTSYIVRLLAENTVGRGSPSESQKFQTKEEEPSGAPTDVMAESRGPTLLRIKWKAPPKEQWNGHLLGYYIGYRSRTSEEPYSYQSTLVTDQLEEEHLLSGLKRATEYSIVVKAYNAAGSGPDSQEVFSRTADSEPPLPPRLWLESHDRFFIVVHWQQPPGPPVTHYIMSYREENGPWRELTVPQADNSKYTLSGLREATRYQIYLQAAGEGSTSAPSETITVLTEGGALSDASMPAPHGSQSRELPVYFRLSVVAPAAASLTIIVLVIAGACLFVSHERRKYKNIIVPPLKPIKSGTYMSGAASLGRPQSQRYVDVDQRLGAPRTPRHADGERSVGPPGSCRPLLGSAIPQYPAPYATLPIRCPAADGPSPSRLTRNAKGTSLSQKRMRLHDILDREGQGSNIIEEAAEIHHYDIAA
ncbi:cell adhesion molecule Dscam1-like isoform X3 [Dermacentor andersoni]|uniref:cell adhesion molecule Dscam1-like isoform X3 n=1 Tax=Dermacentor andersoni TaxID=34620 RepID=UPI003B3A219E